MAGFYLPDFHGSFGPAYSIGMAVGVKLLFADTAILAIHARLDLILSLSDDNLSGLAWHNCSITAQPASSCWIVL
jgi:hypothetical protein